MSYLLVRSKHARHSTASSPGTTFDDGNDLGTREVSPNVSQPHAGIDTDGQQQQAKPLYTCLKAAHSTLQVALILSDYLHVISPPQNALAASVRFFGPRSPSERRA